MTTLQEFTCTVCNEEFDTREDFEEHRFKTHQRYNHLTRYMESLF